MRIARNLGDVSVLLPEGIDHLGDCPYTLHTAITTGLRLLQYEEMPDDERPPKRIWLDSERLEEHFERVKAAREEKYGTKPDGGSDDEPEAEENAVELIQRG